MSNEINGQARLDVIQFWLARTSEEFEEWIYDGKVLIIILGGEEIERYDNNSIDDFLRISN